MSGDSRDCGDLIMPKIARSIADRRVEAPVQFYWHLGDYRALYRIDCDMAKRADPSFNCLPDQRQPGEITEPWKRDYLNTAWQDFIRNQAWRFEDVGIPMFLGIGNHEIGTFRLGSVSRKLSRATTIATLSAVG